MKQTKILIVDDEVNIARTIAATFSSDEYFTEVSHDGSSAWNLLQTDNWDILFLDIRIPGLDGMELLKLVHENGLGVKVIMMTAYGTVDNAILAMKYGAADFIQKPFEPALLKEVVGNILARPALVDRELKTYKEYMELARLKIQLRKFSAAHEAINQALEQVPESAEAYNLLGGVYEAMDDLASAAQAYQMAIKLDKNFKPAAENLARMLSLEGSFTSVWDILQTLNKDV